MAYSSLNVCNSALHSFVWYQCESFFLLLLLKSKSYINKFFILKVIEVNIYCKAFLLYINPYGGGIKTYCIGMTDFRITGNFYPRLHNSYKEANLIFAWHTANKLFVTVPCASVEVVALWDIF